MTHESGPQLDQTVAGQQICILWCAPGHAPSPSLISALTNKGMLITLVHSEHAAFASACRCAPLARRTVIVLDTRELLTGVDRVLSALERFAPGVICWAYRHGANPPMIPVVQHPGASDRAQGAAGVVPKPGVGTRSGPALRLTGQGEPGTRGADRMRARTGGAINARDVLDADELDALLGGEARGGN